METHCGSPLYAAPELLRNTAAYDATKVDVWSLGVVLYALVTKKLPFEGDGLPTILKKIVAGEFTVPPHLSAQVVDLLRKMLNVDPVVRLSVEEIEAHEWVRMHAAPKRADDAIERTLSMEQLENEMGVLQAASGAGRGNPAAEPAERKRPTTMTAADIQKEIATARSEAARAKEEEERAEAAAKAQQPLS